MILLLLALLQINLHESSDSYGIWNKTKYYIKEGKMKVPVGYNYFIFDESNITGLDINGAKMNTLYQSQKEIYDEYGVPNYIFACDNLEERTEKLIDTTHNLALFLKTEYKVDTDNAVILLISMKTRQMRIRTGDSLRRIINDNAGNSIISSLQPILGSENYYEAWNTFLYYIDYYNYKYYNSGPIIHSSSGGTDIINIIAPIISIVFAGIIITCCICLVKFKKKIEKTQKKFEEISDFSKSNKNNEAVFKQYCVLCLKPLYNAQIQITTQADFNNNQQQNEMNSNNIKTFNCGHQFHHNCLEEFKIVDCPICLKQKDPLFAGENTLIIWGIQQNINPNLERFNYLDIFQPKIYKSNIVAKKAVNTNNNEESSYDAPSNIGGGSVGGGSFGGGSIGGASHGSGGAQGGW